MIIFIQRYGPDYEPSSYVNVVKNYPNRIRSTSIYPSINQEGKFRIYYRMESGEIKKATVDLLSDIMYPNETLYY